MKMNRIIGQAKMFSKFQFRRQFSYHINAIIDEIKEISWSGFKLESQLKFQHDSKIFYFTTTIITPNF